ncbi:MAG: outer membrane beta-barrel protein [Bacteroidota bacterium]|nr:outer membrane beta-barrel protein [Bacteroidota bacterium]
MRTNFFIVLLVILSNSIYAQNNGGKVKKPEKYKSEKLKSPDMSVVDGSTATKVTKPLKKASDTSNIIPPVSYSKLSFGLNYGIAFYAGDVTMDAAYPGYGGFVKYSFNHVMGVRAQYLYGKLSGGHSRLDSTAFQNRTTNINLQLIFNVGSVDYRNSFPRNNFYFGVGAGMQLNNAQKDSSPYGTYTANNFTIPLTFGFKRKISKNIDLGIEANLMLNGNDMIDMKNTGNNLPDLNGYCVASIVYNLTTANKPKHIDWSNPINKIYMDLMEANENAAAMKSDGDGDGVPDAIDKEPNTKAGYKVDSKGITLDSDGDGIPDSEDSDPFGFDKTLGKYFPGFNGGRDSAERIYKINDSIPQIDFVTVSMSGLGLPFINFPPNGYTMHVEQYGLLQVIARILMMDTSAALVIIGHADNNKPNLTQLTLAERRALEVKRKLFKIYEIEQHRLLVFSEKDPYIQKYQLSSEGLNRKVEFKIIRPRKK